MVLLALSSFCIIFPGRYIVLQYSAVLVLVSVLSDGRCEMSERDCRSWTRSRKLPEVD